MAFPTVNAYQSANGADLCTAFVAKLDPSASGAASLLYSTYLGGSYCDVGRGIAVDSAGNAYVTGYTLSNDFPTLNAFQSTKNKNGSNNAFVAKLNPSASGAASLLYSTYLGGSVEDIGQGIAVDSSGDAYVTGSTGSSDFPTSNAYQNTLNSTGGNAFVAKLNPSASGAASLLYSTYLGGSSGVAGGDGGSGIAVDSSGNAYVTGTASSIGNSSCTGSGEPQPCCTGSGTGTCIAFPTLNAFQSTLNSIYGNAFVAELNPSASGAASLLYSTYLGGSGIGDIGYGIAVDSAGNAYVTGSDVVRRLSDPERLPERLPIRIRPERLRRGLHIEARPSGVGSGVAALFDLPGRQRRRWWRRHRGRFFRQRLRHGMDVLDRLSDPACLPDQAQRRAECLRGQTQSGDSRTYRDADGDAPCDPHADPDSHQDGHTDRDADAKWRCRAGDACVRRRCCGADLGDYQDRHRDEQEQGAAGHLQRDRGEHRRLGNSGVHRYRRVVRPNLPVHCGAVAGHLHNHHQLHAERDQLDQRSHGDADHRG